MGRAMGGCILEAAAAAAAALKDPGVFGSLVERM